MYRQIGLSARTARAASRYCAGYRPICAGMLLRLPRLISGGRRGRMIEVAGHTTRMKTMAEEWPKVTAASHHGTLSQWVDDHRARGRVRARRGCRSSITRSASRTIIAIVARTPDGRNPDRAGSIRPAPGGDSPGSCRPGWPSPGEGRSAKAGDPRALWRKPALRRADRARAGQRPHPAAGGCRNRVHSFFVEIEARAENHPREAGIEVKLVTTAELADLIVSGEFILQLHIGAIMLAGLRGHIDLAAFAATIGPAKV